MSFSSEEKININKFLFTHYSKNNSIVLNELRQYLRKLCNDKGFINEHKINILISKEINNLLSNFIYDFNEKNPSKYVKINGHITITNNNFFYFSRIILYGILNIISINISLLNFRIKNKLLIKDSDKITLDNVLVLGDIIYTHSIAHEYSDKITLNIDITNTFGSHILIKNVNGNTNVNGNNNIISLNYRGHNKLYGENLELTSLSNIKCVDEILLDCDINYIYTKILELKDINTNNTNESKYKISGLNSKILKLDNVQNNSNNFEIRNCKIDKLIIKNSNLGKAVFNGVTIGKLEIQNATLNDCIFNGVDFEDYELEEIVYKPTIIKKLKECKKKTNIKVIKFVDYKCMKDNYRQLKHIMDKNGNYIEANHFHSLEMEYTMKYYYSLESSKDSKLSNLYNNEFLNFDIIESSNKYILNLSYLINNFGINPIRNFFVILSYIYCVMAISFFSNYAAREIETANYQAVVQLFVGGTMIISAIYIFVCYIRNPVANISKFQKLFTTILFILFFVSLFMDYLHFKGVYTLIYLINPFSGLTPNSMSHLLWTEQIGMIIHKIIYGTLIYQLIISLKRTTKR